MYRDDASYLREWIEFHRLVGVERFFLYNNLSEDEHEEVLAPYVGDGTVVVEDVPVPFTGRLLARTAERCMSEHRDDSRWIAFLDVDEFLFSPAGRSVADLLTEYERWPGVCVPRLQFGSSGHIQRPPGLVVENFLQRQNNPGVRWRGYQVKTIADPARVAGCGVHVFEYTEGFAVDENHEPLDGSQMERPVSFDRLRINHYATKSEEEYRGKVALWEKGATAAGTPRAWNSDQEERLHRLSEVPDDAVTIYLPALREALAVRSSETPKP
jgi:hypothetical protein